MKVFLTRVAQGNCFIFPQFIEQRPAEITHRSNDFFQSIFTNKSYEF